MKITALVSILLLTFAPSVLDAQEATPPLDAERRAAIVDRLSETLQEVYVFPEVAQKMGDHLRRRLTEKAYDGLDTIPAFTQQLTEDLQSISHDKHLRMLPLPPRDITPEKTVDEAERQRRYVADLEAGNFGFAKLERLAGNVGYLDLRGFAPAELAGETAIAAMTFLGHSDAVIFDLRQNGGGSPSMIQLLSSYFFAEPVHLNSFYIRREDKTQQFWSHAHVEGRRMVETPIFVLTSGRTFSAAEEFTYNLKNLERATIIGETTGGGAHPVDSHPFPELGVQAIVPFGRAVNPITGTNWEGTGVTPHVEVPADQALGVAHRRALAGLMETAEDPDRKFELGWALDGLAMSLEPVTLEASQLPAYAGVYGPRQIRLEGGELQYRRDDRPFRRLIPMGDDRFAVDGIDDFRIRFERDEANAVVTLVGLYPRGREEPSPRSGD